MDTSDGGVVFHAGFPNAGQDRLIPLSLDKLAFKHPASTFLWRLSEPLAQLGWLAGTLVVVDRSLEPKNNDLVVVVIDDDFGLRRFNDGNIYQINGVKEQTDNLSIWGVVTNALVVYR